MRFQLMPFFVGVLAAATLLGVPAARAFTIENKDSDGTYGVKKFDLDEQRKQFSVGGPNFTPAGKSDYSTPLPGGGSMSFGVTQGPSYFGPGSNIGSPSALSRGSRQDFDRITAPPSSLEFNGVR